MRPEIIEKAKQKGFSIMKEQLVCENDKYQYTIGKFGLNITDIYHFDEITLTDGDIDIIKFLDALK